VFVRVYTLRQCEVSFVAPRESVAQGVVDVEQQLGGTLVDCSRHILFHFNGGNLSLSVDHVGPGFRLKQTTTCQVRRSRHYIANNLRGTW